MNPSKAQKFSNLALSLKNLCFRILRFIGGLILIYASMIFYLALTERELAFPRAITHKEANEAIKGKAEPLSCTLDDGAMLKGFRLGQQKDSILLYYPDADEDAAQFLAEVGDIQNLTLVAFNYRGSGENKGTPSEKTFETDATQIFECATQVYNQVPTYIAGRGTGAILASQQLVSNPYAKKSSYAILIDPTYSIADKIHDKYRMLYPKFLVRTKVQMPSLDDFSKTSRILVIKDRKNVEASTNFTLQKTHLQAQVQKDGAPLKEKIQATLSVIKSSKE